MEITNLGYIFKKLKGGKKTTTTRGNSFPWVLVCFLFTLLKKG
jgi:hypothetical protein